MSETQAAKTNDLDYYSILGVTHHAKFVQLRKRYITLVQEVHPDRFADPEEKALRTAQFKGIVEAWEVLSNPALRRRYDDSLAGGATFVSQSAADLSGGRSWEAILAEVQRFGFDDKVAALPKEHGKLIREMLINEKEYKEKVIASLKILSPTIQEMPLDCVRGQNNSLCFAVITNLGLAGAIDGKSETHVGNTKYTVTYHNGFRMMWRDTERMELELDPIAHLFDVTFYGASNRFSGLKFKCSGSAYPLMWIADLYDIETVFKVKYKRVGPAKELYIFILLAALLASVGYLYQNEIMTAINYKEAVLKVMYPSSLITLPALALLALLTPIHFLCECLRAARARRTQRVCDAYRAAANKA